MVTYAFFFYALALIACIGAGYVFWTLFLRRITNHTFSGSNPSVFELAITGLFAISMLAMLVNFVSPISHWLSAFVIGLSLVTGFVCIAKEPKPGIFELLLIATVIMLFSLWGAKFLLSYDAGLYHLQAISWMKDEPIVFGLANLHDRLGFNSLMLSALAVFWLPVFEIKGLLLANQLPAMITVLILFNHLLNRQRSRGTGFNTSTLFAIFCVASLSALPFLLLPNTTSTDLAPNIYTLLSAFIFLRAVEHNGAATDDIFKYHIILWIVAIFAILTKLSALTPSLIALVYSMRYRKMLGGIVVQRTAYFLAGVTAIWLLRNFILSGCLIFPIGLTCADTSFIQWSVGSDLANWSKENIEWWAKTPRADFSPGNSGQPWFGEWLQIPNRGGLLARIGLNMMGFPVIVLLYLVYLRVKKRKDLIEIEAVTNPHLVNLILVAAASILGLFFGFLTVPDPRFWWGSLVTLMVLLPVTVLTHLYAKRQYSIRPLAASPIVFLSIISIGIYLLFYDPPFPGNLFPVYDHKTVIPEFQTRSVQTTGFIVRMPDNDDRCWLAPKPCTPIDPEGLKSNQVGPYLIFSKVSD